MGKRLITQRRGRGGPTYRSPSHRYYGEISYRKYDINEKDAVTYGVVKDLISCPGHTAPLAKIKYDTKEEILIEEKDIIKNNIINISKENDANNLFLQLVSYKSINKAKKLIKFYKESSDPILNKLNLIIVTANLSERGTYYRVRVGPYYDIKEIYKLCLVLNVNNNECLIVKDKK
mgnify:CR=1 FL=1